MKEAKHIPVLLQESIESLGLMPGSIVVDATFGGGGHSKVIRKKIGSTGTLIVFDRDKYALERYQKNHTLEKNLLFAHANYSEIETVLQNFGITSVDAILADLGFSSDQIEDPERGLSFLNEGPLDMRLNQEDTVTAAHLVNNCTEEELVDIFLRYGEESRAQVMARVIVDTRKEKEFTTTIELANIIEKRFPRKNYGKEIHPATKVFQALRIAVNQESEHLARFLEGAVRVLRPGGILSVISFHSGEDRQVKIFLQAKSKDCICPKEFPVCRCDTRAKVKILTKKAVRPSEEEVRQNPRSRSAVLRVAQKI